MNRKLLDDMTVTRCQTLVLSLLSVLWSHSRSGLEQDSEDQQRRHLVEKEHFACDCNVTVSR